MIHAPISAEALSNAWGTVADDLRGANADPAVAAAIAETDALMRDTFDTDAHATREVLTVIAEIILFVLLVVAAAAWGGAKLLGAT